LSSSLKGTQKYQRIVASIADVGVIEPLVVYPAHGGREEFLLLDGHIRAEALRDLGETSAPCLVAKENEAYTYNRHVNRLSSLQEHFMISRALKEGVSEERLARALNFNIETLREKRDLLRGVRAEAVELLRHKDVGANALSFLRKVKPMRQIEMAGPMNSANNYSGNYARALYLATRQDQLAQPDQPKERDGIGAEEIARMEREMESLEQDFRVVEEGYSKNILHLVVARDYLVRLLENARVVRFLAQKYPEYLTAFQRLVESTSLEA
jgi:hypothetical protein